MKSRSKLIGLLGAFILSFSLLGGAAANDSEPVSVTLNDSSAPCAIDIYAVGGTFGDWEYDAATGGYVEVGGFGSTIGFFGDVYNSNYNGCDVSISFAGLTGPTGDVIDTSNFSAFSYYQGASVDPASFGDSGVGAGGLGTTFYDFDYTLETVPPVDPGTYTGNIDATISNTI